MCPYCGAQNPPGSIHCLNCGAPLSWAAQNAAAADVRWEYCEIRIRTIREAGPFRNARLAVEAVVMGPTGIRTLDAINDLPGKTKVLAAAVDALTDKMLQGGWQVVGTRYHHIRPMPRFQRRIH